MLETSRNNNDFYPHTISPRLIRPGSRISSSSGSGGSTNGRMLPVAPPIAPVSPRERFPSTNSNNNFAAVDYRCYDEYKNAATILPGNKYTTVVDDVFYEPRATDIVAIKRNRSPFERPETAFNWTGGGYHGPTPHREVSKTRASSLRCDTNAVIYATRVSPKKLSVAVGPTIVESTTKSTANGRLKSSDAAAETTIEQSKQTSKNRSRVVAPKQMQTAFESEQQPESISLSSLSSDTSLGGVVQALTTDLSVSGNDSRRTTPTAAEVPSPRRMTVAAAEAIRQELVDSVKEMSSTALRNGTPAGSDSVKVAPANDRTPTAAEVPSPRRMTVAAAEADRDRTDDRTDRAEVSPKHRQSEVAAEDTIVVDHAIMQRGKIGRSMSTRPMPRKKSSTVLVASSQPRNGRKLTNAVPAQAQKSNNPTSSGDSSRRSSSNTEFTLIIMGAQRVGKSALVNQFLWEIFVPEYRPTVEEFNWVEYACCPNNNGRKSIKNDSKNANNFVLQIIDSSGSRDFLAMRNLYYRIGDAFMVVYNVNDKASYEEALLMIQEIQEKNSRSAPILLIANKCDLKSTENGQSESAEEFLQDFEENEERQRLLGSVRRMKISAKNIEQVKGSFWWLVDELARRRLDVHVSNREPTDVSTNNKSSIGYSGRNAGGSGTSGTGTVFIRRRQSIPSRRTATELGIDEETFARLVKRHEDCQLKSQCVIQ